MTRFWKSVRMLFVACAALLSTLSMTSLGDALQTQATSRRIVVDVSSQRVYAYQGAKLVLSTRANVRGIRYGNFRVQTKLPVARAYTLGWRLPHWLGIYYAGGLENGFHGPAYTARGARTMASLGCVVMPADAAASLYRWALYGTRVTVQQ
jgi:lipoprotein-anchoring transpeptidase ErfK/SrfK